MVKGKTLFCSFLIIFFMCGCGSKQLTEKVYIDKPIYVNVPVLEIPKIKPIARPKLEIYNLNESSTANDVAEAYYNSLQQIIKYSKTLELALEPFYKEYNNARITSDK